MTAGSGASCLNAEQLTRVVRRATADPAATVEHWTAEPIDHVRIIDTTGGLFLLRGTARVSGGSRDWSCVLKVLLRPPDEEAQVPDGWCYWRREADFYASPLVTGLPEPLRAPVPLLTHVGSGEAYVVLEHVVESVPRWGFDEFARAAFAAGRAAGAYLAGTGVPHEPWLASSLLGSLLADGGWWATQMDPANPEGAWNSPVVAEAFDAWTVRRVQEIWRERSALLCILDRLPKVFMHGDFHRRNLMLPATRQSVVALDWGFAGPGPLGADLGDLIAGAVWFCDVDVADIARLEDVVLDRFEAGLRRTGWDGDNRVIRMSYAIAAGLRTAATIPGWLPFLLSEEEAEASERRFGRPVADIRESWIRLEEHLLALLEEGRGLARHLRLA